MAQPMKGWFDMPGRPGDRTLAQQMMGLDFLLSICHGRTVLDAGCAEGLIANELLVAGATHVHGVEYREDAVHEARKVCKLHGSKSIFTHADLNVWEPPRTYDIVIGLAILHKVRNPSALATALALAAKEYVIFRLPPAGAPVVVDDRSGRKPHDIGRVMKAAGFALVDANNDGPFGEYLGTWVRP